jgi:integral membrane sensor domain MASE1
MPIRPAASRFPFAPFALLLVIATIFSSCATKQETALIADPDQDHASTIPWNKPEKWEGRANFPTGLGSPEGY